MRQSIKILLLLFFVIYFFQESVFSQTVDSIYTQVDTIPDFKYKSVKAQTLTDLYQKVIKYYQENTQLKIIKSSTETGAYKGLIILIFVVEKDGTLTNIEIKTLGLETDKNKIEALLVKTEKWIPAVVHGDTVRMRLAFPLYVNLEE